MRRLFVGDLMDKVTLDIAKPMLIKLGKDRVQRADISLIEEQTLQLLVSLQGATPSIIAKKLNKTSQYIGRVFLRLIDKGLVYAKKEGREKIYRPSIDTMIAYL